MWVYYTLDPTIMQRILHYQKMNPCSNHGCHIPNRDHEDPNLSLEELGPFYAINQNFLKQHRAFPLLLTSIHLFSLNCVKKPSSPLLCYDDAECLRIHLMNPFPSIIVFYITSNSRSPLEITDFSTYLLTFRGLPDGGHLLHLHFSPLFSNTS